MSQKYLCVVLHDVAPATWPECQRLLDMVAEFGEMPATLLVVPDYHGLGPITDTPEVVRAINAEVKRGAEIALHGYWHRDDQPAPQTLGAWFRRRLMTASEGEFADLDRADAAQHIHEGCEMLQGLGWAVQGFVSPAWQTSNGTRTALHDSTLRYTTSHTELISLRDDLRIFAPCLTASSRSITRRILSECWLNAMSIACAPLSLVRVGLHPTDVYHPRVMACWRSVLARLMKDRIAITKSQAVRIFSTQAVQRP